MAADWANESDEEHVELEEEDGTEFPAVVSMSGNSKWWRLHHLPFFFCHHSAVVLGGSIRIYDAGESCRIGHNVSAPGV